MHIDMAHLSCLVPAVLVISTDLLVTVRLEHSSIEMQLRCTLLFARTRPFVALHLFSETKIRHSIALCFLSLVRSLGHAGFYTVLSLSFFTSLRAPSLTFSPNFLNPTLRPWDCAKQWYFSPFLFLLAIHWIYI